MEDLTDTDRAIMAALRRNARMTITELSHVTGASRTTVKVRQRSSRAGTCQVRCSIQA